MKNKNSPDGRGAAVVGVSIVADVVGVSVVVVGSSIVKVSVDVVRASVLVVSVDVDVTTAAERSNN